MLVEGQVAPNFTAMNQNGDSVSLEQFRGKKVVLYFYPKDNTPGCTKEACNFRDFNGEIKALGAVVLGVSPDKAASHEKFIEKFELNFDLLVDEDHEVAEAFGAWGEKKNYGKTYMGIIRSTFIIDEAGEIIKVYPKVSAATHGEEVLEWLKAL